MRCTDFCSHDVIVNLLLIGRITSHRQYWNCADVIADVYSEEEQLALWMVASLTQEYNLKCIFESGKEDISQYTELTCHTQY